MYQQILTKKTIWSVVAILFLTAAARAAMQEQEYLTSAPAQQVTTQPVSKPMLFTVRNLIGSEVKSTAAIPVNTEQSGKTAAKAKNQKLEKIGTVKELIINESQNRIEYVVLSVEKTKNVFYPVPWSAFDVRHIASINNEQNAKESITSTQYLGEDVLESSLEPANQIPPDSGGKSVLYLNITRKQILEAPSMTSISTVSLSNPNMRENIDNFYARYMHNTSVQTGNESELSYESPENTSMPATTSVSEYMTTSRLVRFSDIKGLKVENTANKNLGKVYDLVADAHEGQILYSLVHFGGLAGLGQKNAVVPWTAFTLQDNPRYAKINATRETLNRAAVGQDKLYKLNQAGFVRGIFSDFGISPSAVYGFVPGDFDTQSINAWQAGSDYNRLFNSKTMTSIKGTIRDVGTYQPASGASDGIMLTVDTKNGKTFTVYAGPQMYASQKKISFSPGSAIEVKGSSVVINSNSVIMASHIKIANKTLKLYDNKGKPQWNSEKLIREMGD